MNKNVLTWLGCSSSVALVMLTFNAANASEVNSPSAQCPVSTTTNQIVTQPTQNNPQSTSLDASSDTIGDLAIAKFHCDCPACRNQALQMLQLGKISLPR